LGKSHVGITSSIRYPLHNIDISYLFSWDQFNLGQENRGSKNVDWGCQTLENWQSLTYQNDEFSTKQQAIRVSLKDTCDP